MVYVSQSSTVEYSYGNVTLQFRTVQDNSRPAQSYYTLMLDDDAIKLTQDEFANLKGIFAKLLGRED